MNGTGGMILGIILGLIPATLLIIWVKTGDWKDPYD